MLQLLPRMSRRRFARYACFVLISGLGFSLYGETDCCDTGKITLEGAEAEIARNYYSAEKVAAAQANVEQSNWGKRLRDAYVRAAEPYVGREAELWDLVVPEGLPRGITVGYINDPEAYTCRYCGTDLRQLAGYYPWLSDPLNDPWKIQCPSCERRFPSNDFGSFYELGLDDEGNFDYERALQRNAELVAAGEPGYLVNELYPEKGDGWGVDDGFGYRTGRTYPNGVEEVHTYIAYYLHWGLWHPNRQNPGLLIRALNALREAYVLTGDPKYGRTGAILLYRIAEVYPDFDLLPYKDFYNSHGFSYNGKIIGRIWETSLARNLVLAVDAFRPAFADPEVLRFIAERRPDLAGPDELVSVEATIQLLEDNIVREAVQAAKTGKAAGNFGMHQSLVALAAVVLDQQPESREWIDWVFSPGRVRNQFVGGGNVLHQLVDHVTRDGHGNEGSPGYNRIWLSHMVSIADILAGYEGYPSADLYLNPKFRAMFTALAPLTIASRNTAQIGNSGATAGGGVIDRGMTDFVRGFEETGDPDIARWIYFINGGTADGLHGSLYAEGATDLTERIEAIVEEYGPLDNNSSVLVPGFGFGALRDGGIEMDSDGTVMDTQRSFWMYFGRTVHHAHRDALNLGMTAFGLDFAPDLGYPETAGREPNRHQWVNSTLSHNTIMVDDRIQDGILTNSFPLHFEPEGPVKLIDVDASAAYAETDIYRRTVVMIEAGDEQAYGVDFFRVRGGREHLYSFHSQSDQAAVSEGAEMTTQDDGTYAGVDIPYGPGEGSFTQGFSWLTDVRRSDGPVGKATVDFRVTDFRDMVPGIQTARLRLHLRNDFELSELALARGYSPRKATNQEVPVLEYLLARRSAGAGQEALDSLYVTVLEPFEVKPRLTSVEAVPVEVVSGEGAPRPVTCALRIEHQNGRVDYVVYSSDPEVLLRVDGRFEFRGFVGVLTMDAEAEEWQGFLCGGDRLGERSFAAGTLTGEVVDFTRDMTLENQIVVRLETGEFDVEQLAGRQIYIENDGVENAVYEIESVRTDEEGLVILDIGDQTLVRSYRLPTTIEEGFLYNIAEGQSLRIPLAHYFTAPMPTTEQYETEKEK